MKKLLGIVSIINAAALAVVIALTEADIVPIHFNASGQADSWASKWTYLILAAIPVFLSWGYNSYRRWAHGREETEKNAQIEDRTIPAITVLFIALGWIFTLVMYSGATQLDLNVVCMILIAGGALMMYIGNTLPKLEPNHTYGIRIPWTLRDETVWRRTHRFGAYTSVAGGLCMLAGGVGGILSSNALPGTIAGMAVGISLVALAPIIYAGVIYKRIHK
ncbi:hypothetical protein SDC9_172965 [bioreactor metagenome]|uniref:DUF1648 domain-containing protein n=1 Tax=bioreactor metagenome TaxID=1076179 RepID=A0A645GPD2_9ZZZZ